MDRILPSMEKFPAPIRARARAAPGFGGQPYFPLSARRVDAAQGRWRELLAKWVAYGLPARQRAGFDRRVWRRLPAFQSPVRPDVPRPPFREDALVEACLATLRSLGESVSVQLGPTYPSEFGADAELLLALPRGQPQGFLIQTTRTNLSYALAAGFIQRARASGGNWMLFAPYIAGTIGLHLATHGINYADAVGNCHIQLRSGELLAHVEGKKPRRDEADQSGSRAPGYQLLFAILAKPALLDQPVRQLAAAAGIGKTAVADQLKRLQRRGLIRRAPSDGAILRRREILDRWLSAYADIVRPSWSCGQYRTQITDPEVLEREIERLLAGRVWSFGGGAAAWRMTQLYRGPNTVLHVETLPSNLLQQLRALPSSDGLLTILRTPGTVAYEGAHPQVAHPLLVYTEMFVSPDPRMNEAANEIRDRFLREGV
jgi:hypothetical protein